MKVSYKVLDKFLRNADTGSVLAANELVPRKNASPYYAGVRFKKTADGLSPEGQRQYDEVVRRYTNPDGTKKYGNENMIQSALASAKEQMDKIHALDYFSIARNIKGKYKPFLARYYRFKTEKDAKIYKAIESGNVLVVDDILTSGTTLFQLFKALKTVNPAITPTVFTLLGKGSEG